MPEEQTDDNLTDKSAPIDDPALQRLYDWVLANGGVVNCESRADRETGVRGLYASKDITDPNEPIILIPNKLLVSPYHIAHRSVAEWPGGCLKYSELFEVAPELFHPKFPLEPHSEIPEKLENNLGEYF